MAEHGDTEHTDGASVQGVRWCRGRMVLWPVGTILTSMAAMRMLLSGGNA